MIKTKPVFAYFLFITAVFIFLILLARSDLRGSDQYWYVADVNTLLYERTNTTNNIYPVHLLCPIPVIRPHFIHNILNLYLVLPAAALFGSFNGWMVTNIIATILTALLVAFVVGKMMGGWASILAFTVYLLLPVTVWQTSQPLAEATITPFIALMMLIYIRPAKNEFDWGLLVALAGILYYCRSSFSPLLIVLPIVYFIQNNNPKIKSIVCTFVYVGFAVLVVMAKKFMFPEDAMSFIDILQSSVPGTRFGNMFRYFSIFPEPIAWSDICLKMINNLFIQVASGNWKTQVFYLPFNILSAFSIYFFFSKKSEIQTRVAHCGIIILLLHIVTIMVHQNQFRYLLLPTPVLLVCGIAAIERISFFRLKSAPIPVLLAITVCLTVVNVPLAIRSRHEGLKERELRSALVHKFDNTIAQNETIMVDATENFNLIIGYVLRPRSVIYIASGYSKVKYQTMKQRGKAQWLFCPVKSSLPDSLMVQTSTVISGFPTPYNEYGLYSIYEGESHKSSQ